MTNGITIPDWVSANARIRLANGERVVDIAREFGMHRTSISKVKKGTYRGTRNR